MSHQIASDLEGRTWAILSVGDGLKARLLTGTAPLAVMELDELVNTYGPLILSPRSRGARIPTGPRHRRSRRLRSGNCIGRADPRRRVSSARDPRSPRECTCRRSMTSLILATVMGLVGLAGMTLSLRGAQ